MKSNELKEIIRSVIKEELDKTLPTLIPKILTEILSGKQSNVIQSNQVANSTSKNTVQESVQKPKEVKKIPSEGSMVGLDSTFKSQAFAGMQINEAVDVPEPVAPVTEEQGKVMNVLKRDFRSLMKAVDKKKQSGSIGSGMVSMG
jgi:hypothetical protein